MDKVNLQIQIADLKKNIKWAEERGDTKSPKIWKVALKETEERLVKALAKKTK